jgi:hypothetical protein
MFTRTESPRPYVTFHNVQIFCGGESLYPSPISKLEDQPLSAVRDCLFSTRIRGYPSYLDAFHSIFCLRTGHALVTRGPLSMGNSEWRAKNWSLRRKTSLTAILSTQKSIMSRGGTGPGLPRWETVVLLPELYYGLGFITVSVYVFMSRNQRYC